MVSGKHQIKALVRAFNGICHYCGHETSNRVAWGAPTGLAPTREHIVPRTFGGPNDMSNYVLACADCNNHRGSMLFYCECQDCNEKIYDFLYDPATLRPLFNSIINHNKPRITKAKDNRSEKWWKVRIGYNTRSFDTWQEAIDFVQENTLTKEK